MKVAFLVFNGVCRFFILDGTFSHLRGRKEQQNCSPSSHTTLHTPKEHVSAEALALELREMRVTRLETGRNFRKAGLIADLVLLVVMWFVGVLLPRVSQEV
jgi:hypothetical protein